MSGCGARPRARSRSRSRSTTVERRRVERFTGLPAHVVDAAPGAPRLGRVGDEQAGVEHAHVGPAQRVPADGPGDGWGKAGFRDLRGRHAGVQELHGVVLLDRVDLESVLSRQIEHFLPRKLAAEVMQQAGDGGVVGRRAPAPRQQLGLHGGAPAVRFESSGQTTCHEHSFGTLPLTHEPRCGPVEAVLGDEPLDGRRHEIPDRLSGRDAVADHARRDTERRARQHDDATPAPALGRLLDRPGIVARSGRHAEAGELQDRVRLVPGRELQERVGAADEDELAAAPAADELGQRVARVAQPELDLDRRDGEALIALDRQARHLEAHVGRHVAGDVLVRRGARGHEQHLFETELRAGVGSDGEVGDVRRVEAAAEHPDGALRRHGRSRVRLRTCPSPQATYFRQVSSRSEIGPRTWSFCVEMPISAPRPN